MRYDEGHKQRVRQRLVTRAAAMVRTDGVAHTSVAKVMAAEAMTVGGFYRHFDSQPALVAEALAEAMRDARARLFEGLADLRGEVFVAALLGRYLSHAHYDMGERGCPIAATVTELPRLSAAERAPLLAEVRDLVGFVADRIGGDDATARAWQVLCTCVGAMAVARTLGGDPGRALLDDVREVVTYGAAGA